MPIESIPKEINRITQFPVKLFAISTAENRPKNIVKATVNTTIDPRQA